MVACGQSFSIRTIRDDGSGPIQEYKARITRPKGRVGFRTPLPAPREKLTGPPKLGFQKAAKGDLRAWLFLAQTFELRSGASA